MLILPTRKYIFIVIQYTQQHYIQKNTVILKFLFCQVFLKIYALHSYPSFPTQVSEKNTQKNVFQLQTHFSHLLTSSKNTGIFFFKLSITCPNPNRELEAAIYVYTVSTHAPIRFCKTEGGGWERTMCNLHQEA